MRTLFLLAFTAFAAWADNCVTTATGVAWNSTAHWSCTPGGAMVPRTGLDTVQIAHATEISDARTIGDLTAPNSTHGLTMSISGTTMTFSGACNAPTCVIFAGDTIEYSAGATRATITANVANGATTATVGSTTTVGAGTAFTIRRRALYCSAGGSLTLKSGGALTVNGDLVMGACTINNDVGATALVFDTSGITGTPNPYIRIGAVAGATSTISLIGSSSSRLTFGAVTGTPALRWFDQTNSNSCEFVWTDYQNSGDATNLGISCGVGTSTRKFIFNNNTLTSVGPLQPNTSGTIGLASLFSMRENRVVSTPSGVGTALFNQFNPFFTVGTPTDSGRMEGNMLSLPNQRIRANFNTGTRTGFQVNDNYMYSYNTAATAGSSISPLVADFNLLHFNVAGLNQGDYSFVGTAGAVVRRTYCLYDTGFGTTNIGGCMSENGATSDGTFELDNMIWERTYQLTNPFADDMGHPMGGSVVATGPRQRRNIWHHILALPNYFGRSPSGLKHRSFYGNTTWHYSNTLMTDLDPTPLSAGITTGALYPGENKAPTAISAVTAATPCTLTSTAHGMETTGSNGVQVWITGATGGATEMNGGPWRLTVSNGNSLQLTGLTCTNIGSYTANSGTWTTMAPITAASNTTPITITAAGHGFSASVPGYTTNISGVLGNTAANGNWTITNVTTNTFDLVGSVGNGTYSGGGRVARFLLAYVHNNLCWSKAVYSGSNDSGYCVGDSTTTDQRADVLNPNGWRGNATYNIRSGPWLDENGANGVTFTGLKNFRNTARPTTTAEVDTRDLGTASNEMTSGPMFVDSTRNFATFASDYLGLTASGTILGWNGVNHTGRGAWTNGVTYAVGDVVSSTVAGWNSGKTILLRCIAPHTASTGSNTAGQPGVVGIDGWRTNWEFLTAAILRDRWILNDPRAPSDACPGGNCAMTDRSLSLRDPSSGVWLDMADVRINRILWAWVTKGFECRNNSLRGSGYGVVSNALVRDGSDACGVVRFGGQLPGLTVAVQ
jgi:uncharacterized lipoprotein NlpE involved in copper resistance